MDNILSNIKTTEATARSSNTPTTTPSLDRIVERYFQSTLTSFELLANGQELNAINILTLCISLMQMIEQYPAITGSQKKELVLKVFDKYVENHGGNATPFLALLPSFIDTSVSLDKGNIAINMTVADAQEHAVGCCLALLTSKQTNPVKKT